MKTTFQKYLSASLSLTFLFTTSCGSKNPESLLPNLTERSSLAPRPANVGSEKSQLQRFRGQSQFLNPVLDYGCGDSFEDCAQEEQSSDAPGEGTTAREEQESDIYKIGKPGSKLLFLLNNYRGLQVISYADGVEKPKILGRVKATGNYPDEMYYDSARDRLLVLERFTSSSEDSDRDLSDKSRIVAYDVSNPANPKIQEIKYLKGTVADSRMVGDVLYVATSAQKKGAITSYSLVGAGLKEVQNYQLSLPVSQQTNLNIVGSEKEGVFSYHLIATLSESGWGWWDRSSTVEVIDISSPKGKIQTVMSVAAKGFLREKSQTTIRNNTLIVTSNYFPDENSRVARIAVETFRFPNDQSEIITEKEAQYRKLHIDRELQGLSGEAYDQALEKLVNDPEKGIKGRFVRIGDELRKMMPDSGVTVGDGSGLSANLQDVRYQDGLLYAFWVPATEIDPFDLFDISDPENGVKYINRLHFDGWIERAIPMNYQGRSFVLGLGRIASVVNNENGRRRPQAMIFEIVNQGGKYKAVEVAQYTFEGSEIWTNYNDDDKMIEVHQKENGSGEILFSATRYGQNVYRDGGQILNFDLNAIVQQQNGSALKPGAFLAGGAEWIRRVFTNSEINRVNSFSDQSLATFGEGSTSAAGTLQPAHILELARNLRAYETVHVAEANFGVQMISDYSWNTTDAKTTLRVVPADKADTEKPAVLNEMNLTGNYLSHLHDQKSGDLIVLSNSYQNVKEDAEDGYSYQTHVYASRIKVEATGALVKVAEVSWTFERGQDEMPLGLRIERGLQLSYDGTPSLLQLQDGTILAQSDSTLKVLDLSAGLTAQNMNFQNCDVQNRKDVEVQVLNSRPYLSSKDYLDSQEYKDLRMTRNWISPLTIASTQATCGPQTNIPGRAVLVTATGEILSQDTYVEDIVEKTRPVQTDDQEETEARETYFDYETKDALISTKLTEQKAILVDEAPSDESYHQVFQVSENEFAQVLNHESSQMAKIQFLKLDENAGISTNVFNFQTDLQDADLLQIAKHPSKPGTWFGLIGGSDELQVIQWSESNPRPVIKSIVPLNERLEKLEPVRKVATSGSGYYGGMDNRPHFTAELLSFEWPQGLSGVTQVFIQD